MQPTFLSGLLQLSQMQDKKVSDGAVLFICHPDLLHNFFRFDRFVLFLVVHHPIPILLRVLVRDPVYPVLDWFI